jgi:hypothetical protein
MGCKAVEKLTGCATERAYVDKGYSYGTQAVCPSDGSGGWERQALTPHKRGDPARLGTEPDARMPLRVGSPSSLMVKPLAFSTAVFRG